MKLKLQNEKIRAETRQKKKIQDKQQLMDIAGAVGDGERPAVANKGKLVRGKADYMLYPVGEYIMQRI